MRSRSTSGATGSCSDDGALGAPRLPYRTGHDSPIGTHPRAPQDGDVALVHEQAIAPAARELPSETELDERVDRRGRARVRQPRDASSGQRARPPAWAAQGEVGDQGSARRAGEALVPAAVDPHALAPGPLVRGESPGTDDRPRRRPTPLVTPTPPPSRRPGRVGSRLAVRIVEAPTVKKNHVRCARPHGGDADPSPIDLRDR